MMCRTDVCLQMLLFISIAGCGQSTTNTGGAKSRLPMSGNDSIFEIQRLELALSAWEAKRPEDAVRCLTAVEIDHPLSQRVEQRVFRLSESDVKRLPQVDRDQFQSEFIKVSLSVRKLGYWCIDKGFALLNDKKVTEAKRYFEAVKSLGKTLAAPERVLALQPIGQNFFEKGEDGLSQCAQAQIE